VSEHCPGLVTLNSGRGGGAGEEQVEHQQVPSAILSLQLADPTSGARTVQVPSLLSAPCAVAVRFLCVPTEAATTTAVVGTRMPTAHTT
jgi:hypothetical protein